MNRGDRMTPAALAHRDRVRANPKVTPDMQGLGVVLSLRFPDGRTRELSGRLLSVGSGGGVVDADCWPTSFQHEDVVAAKVQP